MGNAGRRRLLIELVNKHSFDCICLQETIRIELLLDKENLRDVQARKRLFGHGYPALVTQVAC